MWLDELLICGVSILSSAATCVGVSCRAVAILGLFLSFFAQFGSVWAGDCLRLWASTLIVYCEIFFQPIHLWCAVPSIFGGVGGYIDESRRVHFCGARRSGASPWKIWKNRTPEMHFQGNQCPQEKKFLGVKSSRQQNLPQTAICRRWPDTLVGTATQTQTGQWRWSMTSFCRQKQRRRRTSGL